MHSVLYKELFDIRYKVNPSILDSIQDELDQFGLDITCVLDYDLYVILKLTGKSQGRPIEAEIRIDRMCRNFTICGFCGNYMLPCTGDWHNVEQYLACLIS